MNIVYGILPPEWHHVELNSALGNLKNQCGKWFEMVVCDNAKQIGFEAICSRVGIGQGIARMNCPFGEIDLIGYSAKDRLLIIGESKMTMAGAEPRFFRDELELLTLNWLLMATPVH